MPVFDLATGQSWIGRPFTSDWLTVDQPMIDRFADAIVSAVLAAPFLD